MTEANTLTKKKKVDTKPLAGILKKYPAIGESLLAILQDVQLEYKYLPEVCLKKVSNKLELPLNQVYAVATFYNAFSLKPKGIYVIQVCLGTACHVRGAPDIVDELERLLNIKCGDTTPDGRFTLESVNCVGACALGPVKVINGDYHGHLTRNKIEKILKQYK
ncbi:MAG: NAD(P)H-dependent oxidoreductase subunit E [Deltaproteobacteria bacterium]|jgi:NADH:ubiquinone oxidoreductase subunit E|nr:NAD(P)H-dependent oxidoreductase subunit E [Deltaproteobacteria bacterium]MBT4525726.1 NAD(P)H-dependent oxidoreductase subunit E [Deltaproteobacteria bacterium]